MKSFVYLFIAVCVSLLITPIIVKGPGAVKEKESSLPTAAATSETKSENGTNSESDISVYISADKNVISVSEFEYVCGSVAAEMPLSYHEEALKAQAVACYTNAVRLRSTNAESTDDNSFLGADISDDTSIHQGYLSYAQRQKKWGDSFESYEEKLEDTVNSVLGEKLMYNNKLCIAAFHAISTVATEDAATVWGNSVDYLQSVKSTGDNLSPSYFSTVSYTKEQFIRIAQSLGSDLDTNDTSGWIKDIKKSDAETVTSIEIGGKTFTGAEIRDAFSLKSASFTAQTTKTGVVFNVRGYGHGVGMSQYGADYMARQGSSYKDILKHYYKGAAITK